MASVPLHEQIFNILKQQILGGELKEGQALVPSRLLAKQIGVSRNTVLTAVQRLETEGYIHTKKGAGCFVNRRVTLGLKPKQLIPSLPHTGFKPLRTDIVDFRSGVPDVGSFPVKQWGSLYKEIMDEIRPMDLGYNQPEGRLELRNQIAAYATSFRGVRCEPEQILVTSGTTQAIGLTGRALLEGSDNRDILLEDPITIDIQEIYTRCSARVFSVPVDHDGFCVKKIDTEISPRLIYVTPSHQFPLGYTMPVGRRIALIEYAKRTDAYIIEDDYDSEYRYEEHPVSSIQGLYPEGVIYIGTFSKTIAPALRIGYLILPSGLIRSGRKLKWLTDLHNSVFDQLVLARFLEKNMYHRHLSKMKKIYAEKRSCLIECLQSSFGSSIQIIGEKAGLHLCVRFKDIIFSKSLCSDLEEQGVKVYPVEEHAIKKGRYRDTIILGFGYLSCERITDGIKLLHSALKKIEKT